MRRGVVLLLAFACCSRTPASPARASKTPPAPVTLRFVNATSGDVFVDARYGERIAFADARGRTLGREEFCGTDCETCNRAVCGSPMFIVRKIAKGGVWQTEWKGDFYEPGEGKKGCTCQVRRFAEDGRYTVTLEGRSAAKGVGAASGSDPSVLSGSVDETSAKCTATGVVTLGAAPSTADLTWSCTPP